ncbi:MAG: restriction endonuclease [Halobacteriaceae archaeon]
MTGSESLAARDAASLADLVAALRTEQGYETARRSAGGREFVLAKQADDETPGPRSELVWVAGSRSVRETQVDQLQSAAASLGATRATVVTVGDGGLATAQPDAVGHVTGDALREALDEAGMSDRLPDDDSPPAFPDWPDEGAESGDHGGLDDADVTSAREPAGAASEAADPTWDETTADGTGQGADAVWAGVTAAVRADAFEDAWDGTTSDSDGADDGDCWDGATGVDGA